MNVTEKRRLNKLKNEVISIYSRDLAARIYTTLRFILSPMIKIEPFIPKSGNILDLGCGSGIFANLLSLGSNERNVLGVDLIQKRIEIAQRISGANPHLEFVVGNVNTVPIDGYDIVTLIDLLHHMVLMDQEELLRNIYNHLCHDGVLIIKDLEKSPYWKYIFHYIQDTISYKGEKLYFRSREEMKTLLRIIGFSVEIISLARGFPHPHILYICRK